MNMQRFLALAIAASAAAAQVTNVESTYVEQVLNGRGGGALKYAGGTINVDSVLQSYPECQSCSANTPCAHRNVLGVGSCIGATTRELEGKKTDYCLDFDVCCGGNCRNSRRPTKKCSFLGSEVKAQFAQAAFNSAKNILAYIQAETPTFTASRTTDLLNSIVSDSVLSARCSSSCNGWTWQGQLAPLTCASSCGCTVQPLPTFVAGNLYECELKVPNADSFFSSGDKTLTKDPKYGALQGKVVCPKGYTCSKPDTCITYETFATAPVSGSSSTSSTSGSTDTNSGSAPSSSSSSNVVGIAVGASVGGLAAIAAIAFCLTRKKKPAEGEYQAMTDEATF